MQHFADMLPGMFDPTVFWLPTRAACLAAEDKARQLLVAAASGLAVPATLYASDAAEAQAFVDEQNICMVKTLAGCAPDGHELPTARRNREEVRFNSPLVTPAQTFQESIDVQHDVRVAVVGAQAAASIIEDTRPKHKLTPGVRDVRAGFAHGTCRAYPYTLPATVRQACIEYTREMGLPATYLDLLVDRRRTHYFVDGNPNGAWAFMNWQAVENTARAIASMLESGQPPWPMAA